MLQLNENISQTDVLGRHPFPKLGSNSHHPRRPLQQLEKIKDQRCGLLGERRVAAPSRSGIWSRQCLPCSPEGRRGRRLEWRNRRQIRIYRAKMRPSEAYFPFPDWAGSSVASRMLPPQTHLLARLSPCPPGFNPVQKAELSAVPLLGWILS